MVEVVTGTSVLSVPSEVLSVLPPDSEAEPSVLPVLPVVLPPDEAVVPDTAGSDAVASGVLAQAPSISSARQAAAIRTILFMVESLLRQSKS